jgi:pilus retraction protein PilT
MTATPTAPILELLTRFADQGASDLFLHEGRPPAARIHGEVRALAHAVVTRDGLESLVRAAAGEEAFRRFQETGDLDTGWTLPDGRRYRFNVSRQQGRLAVVARAVPSGALDPEVLGLPPAVTDLAKLARGLVLITGATGSGKSTTLAALIHRINQTRPVHIVTIEDPIEFVHHDATARVSQREIGGDTSSFHAALRHVLRQSPDVIVIGELRDADTMAVAISASLTGHLVFASLHTTDATQSVQRILNDFPEHLRGQVALDLSLGLKGIVSQRLVPRADRTGRALAAEVLTVTPSAARLLREQRVEDLRDLMQSHRGPEMQTFNGALLDLYQRGLVSFETGRGYATHPDEFALMARGMSTGVASLGSLSQDDDASSELDMKGLLGRAEDLHASDLHLAAGRPPIVRIDGELRALSDSPLTDADVRMLLYSIMNGRQRSQYDLEREVDFAIAVDGGRRFRVNAYHQKGRMAAALRAIPSKPPNARSLGIPETILELGTRPQGLLLVVGPTGAGKSTTLACLLNRINATRPCRIITIEDPVEYVHDSIKATVDQREVYADTKSFAAALKFILRQDPDVILVGEMRDLETVSSALTAAETGHLVLATLHANDAVQAIDSLLGVVSQRLLQRREGSGRIAAFEILISNSAVRTQIRDEKLHQVLSTMERSAGEGMVTMDYAMKRLYENGEVRYEDALRFMRNAKLLKPPAGSGVGSTPPLPRSSSPPPPEVSAPSKPTPPAGGRRFPWNR